MDNNAAGTNPTGTFRLEAGAFAMRRCAGGLYRTRIADSHANAGI